MNDPPIRRLDEDIMRMIFTIHIREERAITTRLNITTDNESNTSGAHRQAKLQTSRPESANQLTLVNKYFHQLFEDLTRTLHIYELEVRQWCFEEDVQRWIGVVPFEQVYSLTVLFHIPDWPKDEVYPSSIASLSEKLRSFIYLRELEIVVRRHISDVFHYPNGYFAPIRERHVLAFRLGPTLRLLPKIKWYQIIRVETGPGTVPEDIQITDERFVRRSKRTYLIYDFSAISMMKPARGWRIAAHSVSEKSTGHLVIAKRFGWRALGHGPDYLSGAGTSVFAEIWPSELDQ